MVVGGSAGETTIDDADVTDPPLVFRVVFDSR